MSAFSRSCLTGFLFATAACNAQTAVSAASNDASAGGADAGLDATTLDDAADAASGSLSDSASLDGSCPYPVTTPFVSDAGEGLCNLTPADVACDASADCTLLFAGGCYCFAPIYGVNQASTAYCVAPPCAAPPNGGCSSTGYITQECGEVSSSTDVTVACIAHVCTTFVKGTDAAVP